MQRLWKIAGMAGMALIVALILEGPFTMSVKAEPATLRSPDATVYEQAGEGSNAVGNLVEGGTFEYIGDVTAEDGSVWHQVQTASGITGYIKGDKEIETGREVPDGNQAAPEGEGGNGGETGQPPETDPAVGGEAEGNPAGEEAAPDPGEGTDTDGEEPEGETEEEEDVEEGEEAGQDGDEGALEGDAGEDLGEDGAVPVFHMQNNQAKKYVVERSQKVKERGSYVQTGIDTESINGKRGGADLALIVGIAVVLLCSEVIHICWKRIKRMRKGSSGAGSSSLEGNRAKPHRKAERKRHSQKKKSTRIIQGKKRI